MSGGFRSVRTAWGLALGLGLLLALTLLTRAPYLGHPAPDFDEQLYSLIGQAMLHGQTPYVDLWDRKPVGLFLIFAAAHGLGGPGPLAYQLAALLACLWGGWLTFRIAARVTDPVSAAFASLLYPLLMAVYGSHAGQSEIFYTPMMLAMAALVLRAADETVPLRALPRLAAAMAMGGLALQVKYIVLPPCVGFGLAALWLLRARGARVPLLGAAALGFAALGVLPTLLAAAWYGAHGELGAFVFANFQSIGLRVRTPVRFILGKPLFYILPLAVLAVDGVIYGLGVRRLRLPLAWWLALGWLVAATAALFMGPAIYGYYYAALVPAVIIVALPMVDFGHRLGPLLLAGVLAWLLVFYNPPRRFAEAGRDRAALAQLAAMAAPHVDGQHCLFVHDGPVALYALTGSCLPSRIIYPDHLNNALEAHALPVDPAAEVASILCRRPGAIVTSPDPVTLPNTATGDLVRAALARDYHLAGRVIFQDRELQAWARDAPGAAGEPRCPGPPQ